LACDETSLWFLSRVPGAPWYNAAHSQGSFVEGLWEDGDVAELFIGDASGRYQEFNVSPAGAWWTCHFNSYRERSSEQAAITPLYVEARRFDSHWEAVIAVKREQLPFAIDATLRAHVSGIVQKPSQSFLSSLPVEGIEPDFHHPSCFLQVSAGPSGT
jgi:hypothetical protein